MMTVEFITALFYEVDEQIGAIPKHPEAHLWPSEVVTLGLLHALKGGGNRAFYPGYSDLWFEQAFLDISGQCLMKVLYPQWIMHTHRQGKGISNGSILFPAPLRCPPTMTHRSPAERRPPLPAWP